jgi:hypothetical protein
MAWSPLVRLETVLTGLDTTLPIVGHTVRLEEAPGTPQQLYVTLDLQPCTARQFDYYMLAGSQLSGLIAARAVAIACINGINGQYLREDAWDRYVEVKYAATTFRGQALAQTFRLYKE